MAKKKSNDKSLRKITKEELDEILESHHLWRKSDKVEGEKADLSYCDLSGMDLRGISFSSADLSFSDLSETLLHNCNFFNADLSFSDLSRSNCEKSFFIGTDLSEVDFSSATLLNCRFDFANLFGTNFNKALLEKLNFRGVKNLEAATISHEQLKLINNVPNISIPNSNNVENQASFEIEELKKKLQEREEQLSHAEESEKEKIRKATELLEKALEERKKELERERAAKKSTKEDIENGITHLQAPNKYLKSQIIIQYCLTILYGIIGIIVIWFLFHYIKEHYSEFKVNLTEKTTFLQWLFYALPVAVCFSLIITFINQINKRLRNVIILYEKKRYVDSISGGLKAVQELSENNKEARIRISSVLDEILNNTITLSEKLQEDTLPEEKPIDNKVSVSLKDLKDLFSK